MGVGVYKFERGEELWRTTCRNRRFGGKSLILKYPRTRVALSLVRRAQTTHSAAAAAAAGAAKVELLLIITCAAADS